MISRVRLGDVFLGLEREGVVKVSRRGVAVCPWGMEGVESEATVGVSMAVDRVGASEGALLDGACGFNGVRKGDLKGLWSVFEASFSRRRLACGVDMISNTLPLAALVRCKELAVIIKVGGGHEAVATGTSVRSNVTRYTKRGVT